jgi:hypothetical protein
MRVLASSLNTTIRDAAAARRAGGGGFSLSESANAATRSGPAQLHTISGVDVLVALQGVEDKTERRRRAVRQGQAALDALETLKLALLSGTPNVADLNRLQAAAAGLVAESGEPELDSVLAAIDLRVQVEIAKLSRR